MLTKIQLDQNARWKQRFRAPIVAWTQIALANPTRGLVATNMSGKFQLHTWDVPSSTLRQLTNRPMLTQEQAQQQIDNFIASWTILDTTAMMAQEAVRGVRTHRLSYYDAQVWAAARLNQVGVIFSEDFPEGSTLEGVRFVNPFTDGFVLEPGPDGADDRGLHPHRGTSKLAFV